jgi:hypothetical protein
MAQPLPGLDVPVVDPPTGLMTQTWYNYFQNLNKLTQSIRERLTVDTTVFVRSDGNDLNLAGGRVDSPAGAFATWQAAVDYVFNYFDFQGHAVTLKKGSGGSGTFSEGLLIGHQSWVGGGQLIIDGGSSASCHLNLSSGIPIFTQGTLTGNILIKNIKLTASQPNISIRHAAAGIVRIGDDVDFGTSMVHAEAHHTGAVFYILGSSYKISGGATVAHMWGRGGGTFFHEISTVTISGTPTIGVFARVDASGIIQSSGSSFVGATTGQRFLAGTGGQIATFTGDPNYFPGSIPGVADAATFGSYS